MSDSEKQWTEALRQETREALDEFAMVPMLDFVCMKNIDGRFGTIAIEDWLERRFKVRDRQTGQEITFANVDELILAGWAID